MSLLGNPGAGAQHRLSSLDAGGQLAAVYPSEEQLWYYGPALTDPGAQGVETGTTDGYGPAGADPYPIVLEPHSPQEVERTEAWLHDVMNGETPNGAYGEEWVNLSIGGPAGYGNFNEQPFFTGHSQIVQSNPASEQGWGVGPARRWAHYPFSQLDNPVRNMGNHLRMGQLPWAFSEQSMLYARTQLAWEQQWAPYKQRNPVAPVVPVPSSVPFTQTVPTYSGGPIPHPGLDIVPLTDTGSGIY